MPSKASFTYKDYDGETSTCSFDITTMTAANFDATNTAVNALSTAILGVQTENSLQTKRILAMDNFISRAKASDKGTQREHLWVLTLEDATTHRLFTHQIPQADVDLVGTDVDTLDLTADPGLALKTAIEAVVKAPGTGNAVLLAGVHYTGNRA